jgi:hypothetical protein
MTKPAGHKYHKTRERSYKPSKQLDELNGLTKSSLGEMLPLPALNVGKITPQLKIQAAEPTSSNTFECSSQLMIMRHCDKDVQVKDKNGKIRTRDKRDFFGDGHCSKQGKARSEFIAALFNENEEFQALVNGTKETVDDLSDKGVPPIATEVSSEPDVIKSQFPTPLKLYALNDARYNKNPSKEHKNFREVETVTPLADKFHLEVDEDFGVNEEGDLATDFFTSLSESVKMNVDRTLHGTGPVSEGEYSKDEIRTLRLCQGGMTVVNWKHSLIPNLARALGCGKDEGCPKKYYSHDFDTVWVITYKYSVPLPTAEVHDATTIPVETLSKGNSKSSKQKHRQLTSTPTEKSDITWEITAQTVKEGFDQV